MRFLKNCKGEVFLFFIGLSMAITVTGLVMVEIIKVKNKYKIEAEEEKVTYLDEDEVIEIKEASIIKENE